MDIVITDLYLGKESGLDIIHNCNKLGIKTKFIILTSSERHNDFIRSSDLGVKGYILKKSFVEDIIYAVKTVYKGRKYYDIDVLIPKYSKSIGLFKLTTRETNVFKELGKGISNKQIADNLFISENTVKKHVSSILRKLGFAKRAEIAILANNISQKVI